MEDFADPGRKGGTEGCRTRIYELVPRLSHRTEFLLEGARCLQQSGQYSNAIIWSRRAIRLSADPEFYYILAQSHQQLGLYKLAEKYLLQCLHILPEQIDTYYLLTKLYAETNYYHPDKLRLAAHSVLTKQPDTCFKPARQMKEEVYQLLYNKWQTVNRTIPLFLLHI